uniref:Uncharacterized protein n=1 Tax=Oryza barthii TaxID=65489 RepID=A0A0D3GEX2_9ORYZ
MERRWSGQEMGPRLLWRATLETLDGPQGGDHCQHRLQKLVVPLVVATIANGGVGCESSSYLRSEGVPPLVVVISCPIAAALVVVPPHRYGEAGRERRAEAIRMGKRRAVVQTSEARRLRDQDLNGARPSSEAAGKAGV